MTSRRSHGHCVLAIWFLAAGLAAGQAQPVMLLLDDAIARALAASHRLEELGARRDGAAAQVESVRTSDRPLVAVHGSYTRTNHVEEFVIRQPIGQVEVLYPDVPDNYQTRLDLQWPVYTAGRTEASKSRPSKTSRVTVRSSTGDAPQPASRRVSAGTTSRRSATAP